MLIRVEHSTSYEYSEPLLATTQYLRMTPLSGRTQAVESWALTCPGATMSPWQDQYGNACHTLTVTKPVETSQYPRQRVGANERHQRRRWRRVTRNACDALLA